ncbi:MAG: DUF4350 domain-containing protein [Pseudomonadales bacterium]
MTNTPTDNKTRWQTFFWFSVTLVVLVLLVARETTSTDDAYGRPTTENRRSPGIAALHQWLLSAEINTLSLRSRFTDLPAELAQTTGNIAIVHLPGTLVYEAEEIAALLHWVATGNTLLIAAGHLEGNRWIYEGQNLPRTLWRLTGLELSLDQSESASATPQEQPSTANTDPSIADRVDELLEQATITPGWLLLHDSEQTVQLVATEPHPLTAGLAGLTAPWDGARWSRGFHSAEQDTTADQEDAEPELPSWQSDLNACRAERNSRALRGASGCIDIPTPTAAAWQPLLRHQASEQLALLASPLEQGEIFVLLHPSLLGNEVMHRFNNRGLMLRLLDQSLSSNGTVVFDDAHQGLNNILESGDLLSDSRFWASIGFLMLFWVAYLLADAGQWQRAVTRVWPRTPSQRDLVHGSANFLEQRLHPAAALEALLEPLQEQLARKWQLPRERALSQGLAQERDAHPEAVAALEQLLDSARTGRGPALAKARHTIHTLRQAIA